MAESKSDKLEKEIHELIDAINTNRDEGRVGIPYNLFLRMIDRLETIKSFQWNSIEDELPEEFMEVLAYYVIGEEKHIEIALFDGDNWTSVHTDDEILSVLFWRGMPEPSSRTDGWNDHSCDFSSNDLELIKLLTGD